jgi:hypothetical protein
MSENDPTGRSCQAASRQPSHFRHSVLFVNQITLGGNMVFVAFRSANGKSTIPPRPTSAALHTPDDRSVQIARGFAN